MGVSQVEKTQISKGGVIMAKVIMTCGLICCGKSTYAKKIQSERNAVILSIDDLTLTMFPSGAGDMHDTYVLRSEEYLLTLSLQILQSGVDVILDWGLWTQSVRKRIRDFYASHGAIKNELHYLRIDPVEWKKRIEKRNASGESAYYVDEGLREKAESLFEEPSTDEVDVLIEE